MPSRASRKRTAVMLHLTSVIALCSALLPTSPASASSALQRMRPPISFRARFDAAESAIMSGAAGRRMLKLLVVECYDEPGIDNLKKVGCRKASDIFTDVLRSLTPEDHVCSVTVVYPCVASYDMASVEELSAFDGVVWTGSSLTIHHDTPLVHRHIELARRCYAAAVPQYGSCWGLQISAAAAGLPCEENPRGREHVVSGMISPSDPPTLRRPRLCERIRFLGPKSPSKSGTIRSVWSR